jgi:vanillate O-demethylase monooxygenase subunit
VNFLGNAWYIAGWSSEIRPGELYHLRMLNEAIVIFPPASGRTAGSMSDGMRLP